MRVATVDRLQTTQEQPRILLVSPDIRYYLLTASGLPEPHAEWTGLAQQNFAAAAEDFGREHGLKLIRMPEGQEPDETEVAYQRLHAAVGNTVLVHHFGAVKLPAKAGAFDWTLGNGVSTIGEKYTADYALFSFYRDYQASGGRVAMGILMAAAGIAIPMGGQFGFASLVDLRTGDVVWFNQLSPGGTGDLRTRDNAEKLVIKLLAGLPGG